MDYKTVGKSNSSNGDVVFKIEKRFHKKSQSNAGFQPSIMKKRGVYVEKKVKSSTDTQDSHVVSIKKKPPPRPRPGKKKFLTSVLTILSKSTTGTQYPDIQEDEDKTKLKRFKPCWKTNDKEQSSKTIQKINKTKKNKFKSRVLNNEMLRAENEQLIILQSKKDITQTPSNYSAKSKAATDSIKWSDMLQENEQPKRNPIRDILESNIYSGVAEGITKEILEGRTKEVKKLRIRDDPETLVSKIAKKDDKQLYNFFVDLLETTINVYNVKTDYEPRDSEIHLEINDSVVKKLEFKNESHENVNRFTKCVPIDGIEKHVLGSKQNLPIDIKLSEYKPLAPIRRKIRAKSFTCPYSRKAKMPSKSNSFEMRKTIGKPKKKALLSLLKEQLEMDTYTQEPESLYDALKVMARNKQRCEKFIRFDNKSNINNDFDPECMFERRKIISFKAKKKGKSKHNTATYELRNRHVCDEEVKMTNYFPSHHSLEVYGYDYEEPIKNPEDTRQRRVILTYHSSPSGSDSNLDNPDSTASSNYSVFNR